MQTAIVTITPGAPDVRVARPLAITRSMDNVLQLTLQTASGAAADLSGALGWEMGVTQDFYAATPILAGTSSIAAVSNVLTITLSGATLQLAEVLDGKRAAMGFATLKGFDAAGKLVHVYIIPLTLCNIGYNGDLLTDAVLELYWTAAQIEAKLADIAGTLEIPQDLSDLTDTEGLLATKADIEQALPPGGAAGDILRKTTSEDYAAGWTDAAALTPLTGTSVTVGPFQQYYWSAAGTCTLTVSGFAATGLQSSALLIDVAAGATIAVSGATVAEDDAVTGAGQYMVYLINQNGTVYFRIASYTEAA